MNKQNKKGLVPALRFPEFERTWKKKKLGYLSNILRGGSPRPIDEYITNKSNGLNWLKIADVNKNSKYVTSTKERVIPTALSKTREVNPGDLIMSNSMSFGRPYILKIKSCIHDGWIAITEINEKIYRDYLYYLILGSTSQAYFTNNAAGSGVQNLNADIIKLLPISFPDFPEQQKIADCLSSLDELIAAQTKKHKALQSYKKGLMQNLFPAEGETVPALRFSEFEEVWLNNSLGNIGLFTGGGTPSKSEPAYWTGNIPWVSSSDIFDESITDVSITRFITKKAVEESATKLIPENSILLVSRVGVGKLAVSEKSVCTSQDFMNFTPDKDNIHFLAYYLKANSESLLSFSQGMAIKGFTKEDVSKLEVWLPKLKEQQKIADCLSSVDELIAVQAKKIEALKAHKKGLMQQLFPSIEAVE